MKQISSGELARLQADQESAMMDLCVIGDPATTYNDLNDPITTISWRAPQACRFVPRPSKETGLPDKILVESDAAVRLPVSTLLDSDCQVKILAHLGQLVNPSIYAVVGEPTRHDTALLVGLRRTAV